MERGRRGRNREGERVIEITGTAVHSHDCKVCAFQCMHGNKEG